MGSRAGPAAVRSHTVAESSVTYCVTLLMDLQVDFLASTGARTPIYHPMRRA